MLMLLLPLLAAGGDGPAQHRDGDHDARHPAHVHLALHDSAADRTGGQRGGEQVHRGTCCSL